MCLYPQLIKNKKYTENQKNGGIIPPVPDERVKWVAIGCGNCIECRKQKARGWQVRLLEDIKTNRNGKFITLTLSNESFKKLAEETEYLNGYELDNRIATRAMRLFLERWRKKYKKSLRHWMITELGHEGTENVHIHGIVWTDISLNEVENIWQYGYVWKGKTYKGKIINYVNEKTVNYIIKYVTKIDDIHKTYKPKILCSKGIGGNYKHTRDSKNNEYKGNETEEAYRTRTGHKISMPVYWRNAIYTDEEREKLWIQRLDKNERWILGVKVDVSNGYEEYFKGLKWARKKNKRLGYGDNEKDWDRIKYEKELRNIKHSERIKKAGKDKDEDTKCLGGGQ